MEFGAIDVSGLQPNVATGATLWRYGGTLRATIIAKATFDLAHDLPMRLSPPEALVGNERHVGNNPTRSISITSDAVPYRPRADVTFVGHACAPSPVPAMLVRLALYRDSMILERALHVYGDRDAHGEVVPFTRMPIAPERARISAENPIGTPQPNILDARGPAMPAWLGPVSRVWPLRKQFLRGAKPPLASDIVDVPAEIDWSYYQAALMEQQVSFLRGDEWIVLDGVHPSLPRLKTQLPLVRALARVFVAPADGPPTFGPGHPLDLVTDALTIDGDKMKATLSFRGSFPLENESLLPRLKVLVGLELGGVEIRWPAPETIAPPRPVVAPKAASKEDFGTTRTLEDMGPVEPASAVPFRPAAPKPFDMPAELEGTFMLSADESSSLGAHGNAKNEPPTDGGAALTPKSKGDPRSSA